MAKSPVKTSTVAAGAEKKTTKTPKVAGAKEKASKTIKLPAGGKKTTKATKTAGKVSKVARVEKTVEKALENPNTALTVADMVRDAFEKNKSTKGNTLQSIRNYITKEFDVEMTKRRQTTMKKFIKDEFDEGRMKMTNHDGEEINYTKRFKVIASSSK